MARTATVTRNTRETQITLTIDLDGTGRADLHTGIGFFDHMLDGFARHGLFDLEVEVKGDLEVDTHHTTLGSPATATWRWTTTTPPRTSALRWARP